MKTINFKRRILEVLKELAEQYPKQAMSTHISLALADFPHFDGISDKELFFVLEKYRCERELDITTPMTSDEELIKIYKDSEDLNIEDLLDEDDEF